MSEENRKLSEHAVRSYI